MDETFALAARIAGMRRLQCPILKKAIVEGLDCSDMDQAIEVEAELLAGVLIQ